ncbi:FAD-binding protein [Sesbania bispinosa]|nr:FAD-binding protein [Sesbania bispinosa]
MGATMGVIGIQRQQRKIEACMSQLWLGWVRMVTVAHSGDAAWVLVLDGAVRRSRRVSVTFGGGLECNDEAKDHGGWWWPPMVSPL